MWNAQTGQELHTFSEHTHPVDGLAFSPDGHFLASDGIDNIVIIWDATPLLEKP